MQATEGPSILIVGASHCGGRTAQLLRAYGWADGIDIVGDEPSLTNERPPLSKELLTGDRAMGKMALFGEAERQAHQLRRHLAAVTAIDTHVQTAKSQQWQHTALQSVAFRQWWHSG